MPKVCAYSINEGKSISNPMGWCCLSSFIEVKFDSINLSPVKADKRVYIKQKLQNTVAKSRQTDTLVSVFLKAFVTSNESKWEKSKVPLFILSSPIPHCFNARIHAKVDNSESFNNNAWRLGSPHEPSTSWLSSNQFKHWGKNGAWGDVEEGIIATKAVSYDETESSTLLNMFLILSLESSKHYNNKNDIYLLSLLVLQERKNIYVHEKRIKYACHTKAVVLFFFFFFSRVDVSIEESIWLKKKVIHK